MLGLLILFGKIINCSNSGSITAFYTIGGIAGDLAQEASIETSFNQGNIKALRNITGAYVGGIVGNTYGKISYCYNIGMVEGNQVNIGGIAGQNYGGIIENCYNIGSLKRNNKEISVGGVAGANYKSGKVLNCFFLNDVNDGIAYFSDGGTIDVKSRKAEEIKEEKFLIELNNGTNKFKSKKNNNFPILEWE